MWTMKQDFEKGKQRKTKMRYMPGLDGLRAIAVLGIIIYHLNRKWLTGGFIGVDTFFVISGYLITSLLLKEYEERGIISLKQFWIRRVKKVTSSSCCAINRCWDCYINIWTTTNRSSKTWYYRCIILCVELVVYCQRC